MSTAARGTIIGAVAYAPKVVTVWNLMREYLCGHGFPMDYLLFSHYDAQITALLERRVDIAWNTNLAYARTQELTGGTARAICMRDSDLDFRTHLICRAAQPISSLSELRGMTLALGSADSTQAAILPYHYLLEAGIDPERELRLLRFDTDVGKHGDTGTSERDVVRAVVSGAADAGAVSAYALERMLVDRSTRASELTVFWTTPGYSHCVLTGLADGDLHAESELTRLLTTMDPNEALVQELMRQEEFRHWVPGSEGLSGYKIVFAALNGVSVRRHPVRRAH